MGEGVYERWSLRKIKEGISLAKYSTGVPVCILCIKLRRLKSVGLN